MSVRPAAARFHWRALLWGSLAALYLLPVLAMLSVPGAAWTGHDFAVAALLLGGTGLAIEAIVRGVRTPRARIGLSAVAVAAAALIWADGAIGVF